MFDGDCSTCSEPSDSDWCPSCKKKFSNKTMDNKELFKREYLCKWIKNSEEYYKAYKLWIDYEYNCEKFDKIVCHGEIDKQGFIRPRGLDELRSINQNANYLRDMVFKRAKKLAINNKDLEDARKEVNKLTWKGIQEEYQRLSNMEDD